MLKRVCDLCECQETVEKLATTVPYARDLRQGEICISTEIVFHSHGGYPPASKPDLCKPCLVYLLGKLYESVDRVDS